MGKTSFSAVLTDSSERAKWFIVFFAVFSAVYHAGFEAIFFINKVTPMIYINCVSVPFFLTIALLSPSLKSYVLVYLISMLEIYSHQFMGLYFIGYESGFHYFFIPFCLLPLYTFKEKLPFAIVLSAIGGIAFFCCRINKDKVYRCLSDFTTVNDIYQGHKSFPGISTCNCISGCLCLYCLVFRKTSGNQSNE